MTTWSPVSWPPARPSRSPTLDSPTISDLQPSCHWTYAGRVRYATLHRRFEVGPTVERFWYRSCDVAGIRITPHFHAGKLWPLCSHVASITQNATPTGLHSKRREEGSKKKKNISTQSGRCSQAPFGVKVLSPLANGFTPLAVQGKKHKKKSARRSLCWTENIVWAAGESRRPSSISLCNLASRCGLFRFAPNFPIELIRDQLFFWQRRLRDACGGGAPRRVQRPHSGRAKWELPVNATTLL